MLVYDSTSTSNTASAFECTYTTFQSNHSTATPEHPILILDNSSHPWEQDSAGIFANPYKKTAFEFQLDDGVELSNILQIDSRFISLIKWLGENRIKVKLTGENRSDGYAVYKIREVAFSNSQKLSSEDGFLQFMIERLLESDCRGNLR